MDKIKPWYIFRIDDITPWMNWDNFFKIEKIFDNYGIKPIIWVVPNNKDKKLDWYWKIDDFWMKIMDLEKKWWIIAQHWFEHNYKTNNSWIIWLNNYSEFAWLSYKEQFEKISQWKEILENNLWKKISWWMAPAHSFDKVTCEILNKLWFEYITDWISLFPFKKYWLNWLPQQIWKPRKKIFWIWTICLHINNYDIAFIKEIENFCKSNSDKVIKNYEKLDYSNNIFKNIFSYVYKIIFYSEQSLYLLIIKLWEITKKMN